MSLLSSIIKAAAPFRLGASINNSDSSDDEGEKAPSVIPESQLRKESSEDSDAPSSIENETKDPSPHSSPRCFENEMDGEETSEKEREAPSADTPESHLRREDSLSVEEEDGASRQRLASPLLGAEANDAYLSEEEREDTSDAIPESHLGREDSLSVEEGVEPFVQCSASPHLGAKPNGADIIDQEREVTPDVIPESNPRQEDVENDVEALSIVEKENEAPIQPSTPPRSNAAPVISFSPASSVQYSEVSGNSDRYPERAMSLAGLKEAVAQRTDTSKPGYFELSRNEQRRIAKRLEANTKNKKPRLHARDLILPSRKIADRYLAIYLTREYVNLPVIHLPTFQTKYLSLWSRDFRGDSAIVQGIVNVMLALGCLAIDPTKNDDACLYFARAQNLIRFGSLDGEDLACVQAYIISTQFLHAIGNLAAAWKSIGIAIRVSQSLHLHLKSGSHHLEERVERELAKRVWHCCIMQERPSIVEFFTSSSRLYEKYEDILSIQEELRITEGRSPRKVIECFDPQKLLEVDRLLCSWNAALPPFLQPNGQRQENSIAERQHIILRIRYLHMRILLWRPLLAILAADPEICGSSQIRDMNQTTRNCVDTPLIYTIATDAALKCIASAQEIIEILTKHEQINEESHHVGPVPPWWDNIGYAFCCATTMLGARMSSSAYEDFQENTVEEGWNQCIDLLTRYCAFSPLAAKCLEFLEELATTVTSIDDDDDEEEVKKEGNADGQVQRARDVTWLESLPVDLRN
ncbi:predicted protein [Uncinocarpus reesii 1704]|uniref:Xylanolytic transcriptional activator regulatory domain-containing protein n=1 Tax=Uncinocarpus reesii (strain UAMH 1704) TaxID=336963 RepID=C4JTT4_UNCRE|nr:uncharacterized protein UREG_05873 [Uncinocarpus reesii 1704]EEP81031.1 predicted protein [Uncinocarpus reesii 1704]